MGFGVRKCALDVMSVEHGREAKNTAPSKHGFKTQYKDGYRFSLTVAKRSFFLFFLEITFPKRLSSPFLRRGVLAKLRQNNVLGCPEM